MYFRFEKKIKLLEQLSFIFFCKVKNIMSFNGSMLHFTITFIFFVTSIIFIVLYATKGNRINDTGFLKYDANLSGSISEYGNPTDTKHENQPKYIVCVKSCAHRFDPDSDQFKTLEKISKKNPVIFFYYIGDPTLSKPFTYDSEKHLLTVKCKDDYMNLCHKVGLMFRAMLVFRSLNNSDKVLGMFMTDDDIHIQSSTFFKFLERYKDIPYWGHISSNDKSSSPHIKRKIKQSSVVKNSVEKYYKGLETYDVEVESMLDFCPGGGMFLHFRLLGLLLQREDLFQPFPNNNEELMTHLEPAGNGTKVFTNVCLFDDFNIALALKDFNIYPVDVPIKDIVSWDGL